METTTTVAVATYSKLSDGTWGVRMATGAGSIGARVTVSKRDGSSKTETLAGVVGTQSGHTMWRIATVKRAPAPYRANRPRTSGRGGSAADVPGYSSWCTGRAGCGCYDCE